MSNIFREDTNQRMSQIVIHDNTIYLSGQVGNKDSNDVATQTSEVLNQIKIRYYQLLYIYLIYLTLKK